MRCRWDSMLALMVVALIGGCGGAEETAQRVYRFTDTRFAELNEPANSLYAIKPGDWILAGTSGILDAANDSVKIEPQGAPATISARVDLQAEQFTDFEIRMRVDGGTRCRLRWRSAVEPEYRDDVSKSIEIFPGDEFYTYKIPLGSIQDPIWIGRIEEIALTPSNRTASIEIEHARFVRNPLQRPLSVILRGQTHEALLGRNYRFRLRVPEHAVFETYVGLSTRSWQDGRSDGAEFIVQLTPKSQDSIELLRVAMNPSQNNEDRTWKRLESDLGAYAGQDVSLSLSIDFGEESTADYAFWGNPMVYQENPLRDAIPVIFISNDTLRADHVGVYGYERDTTPAIDAFREDAVLFENAYCSETYTLTSHMTMLTGLYPLHHGVSERNALRDSATTLGEALQRIDYVTAGFTGFSWLLNSTFGYNRGFDIYNVPPDVFRNVEETSELARRWLANHDSPGMFLFFHDYDIHGKLHFIDTHFPYFPERAENLHFSRELEMPPIFASTAITHFNGLEILDAFSRRKLEYDDEVLAYTKALYDDGIRYVDGQIGILLDTLKTQGLYDRALIVVTADHGEEFTEHGGFQHGQPYEETARVPLLIKFPQGRFSGTSFSSIVQLADLFPTVLDVLGQPIPEGLDGRSILSILEGRSASREIAFSKHFELKSYRKGDWKILMRPGKNKNELYNLAEDPGERQNLARSEKERLDSMAKVLDELYSDSRGGWHLLVRGGDGRGAELNVSIRSDSPIDSVERSWNDIDAVDAVSDSVQLSDDRKELRAHFFLAKQDADEIVFLQAPGSAKIEIEIVSGRRFSVAIGDRFPFTADHYEAMLDPAEKPYPKKTVRVNPFATRPMVLLWYAPPPTSATFLDDKTEEIEEQLRSLGYIE